VSRSNVAPLAGDRGGQPLRIDRYRTKPELYVESDRLARMIAGLVSALVVVGTVWWIDEAVARFGVPEVVRPDWFRWTQLSLAVAGVAGTIFWLVHLVRYTVTGLVWRYWRATTFAFVVAATAWTTLWLLDRFVLDGVIA
jgi:type IV secretory pathway TrbD component